MRIGASGQVSRGFFPEIARHLARVFDVPDGGGGCVGHRARGGFSGWSAAGELSVFWRDWTSQLCIEPRGDLSFDWGRGARWSDARELSHAVLGRIFRAHYATRWIEPIMADEFTRQIVRHLPDDWHLSDEAARAWVWRFELRRWEACGPTLWRRVQRDLDERRARYRIKRG